MEKTFKSFKKRAVALLTHLEPSKVSVPPTLFVEQYLAQLNKCDKYSYHLAKFNRVFSKHLRDKEDTVEFPSTIGDIYDYLEESKCSPVLLCPNESSIAIIPSANYDARNQVSCEVCDKPLSPIWSSIHAPNPGQKGNS